MARILSPHHLRATYVTALSLVALMTFTSHVILDRTIAERASDGAVINVAGKQRMLSQKITKLALKFQLANAQINGANTDASGITQFAHANEARSQLAAAHAEWFHAHQALQHGDPDLGLPVLDNAGIQARFVELNPHFEAIDRGVRELLRADAEDQSMAVARILANEGLFLDRQDQIVGAFETYSAQQIASLSGLSRWLLTFTLCLLAVEAMIVFEPARRMIRRQLQALIAINERMKFKARHDELTGLPNRASLMDDLADLCRSRAAGDQSREFAVCFVDFDRFKAINDSLGHDAGDELLCNIAARIGELSGYAAPLTLNGYRLGGDEFVLVLVGSGAAEQVEDVLAAGIEIFARPHRLMNQDCVSTASIGVVTSHEIASTPDILLRDADLAMIQAKDRGKSQFVVFDQAMYAYAARRQQIESGLRQALDADTLDIRFQPIYGSESLELEAVEALLYWEHPVLGHISNEELIDVAEEAGLIQSVGAWVLDAVARALHADDHAWLSDARFLGSRVHVNVSHAEIMHPGFCDRISRLIADYPEMRGRLCLECPASVLGRSGETFQTVIDELHAVGVLFALDHLDREQVSMTQLATLPLDAVKVGVPKSLTGGDVTTQKYAAVLQAIVLFAQHRDIRVVGTGVESNDQIAAATASNVSSVQGNLLRSVTSLEELRSQPMPDTLANALDGILSQIPGIAA